MYTKNRRNETILSTDEISKRHTLQTYNSIELKKPAWLHADFYFDG